MLNLRHSGVVVKDMETSLRFYRDLLGLKVVRDMLESGEYVDSILSLKGASVRTVKLSADKGDTLLELLEFKSQQCERRTASGLCDLGPTHIAFTVENLDTVYGRLKSAGTKFNSQPKVSPELFAKVVFCRDPDGTFIELVEQLRTA